MKRFLLLLFLMNAAIASFAAIPDKNIVIKTLASQPYSAVSSVSVTSGKYIAVKNSEGTVLFSYKCPNTVNSATVLLSSPEFTKTSHTLMYGVTSVSDATETLFGGVYSVGGVLSGGSSKTFTPQTK